MPSMPLLHGAKSNDIARVFRVFEMSPFCYSLIIGISDICYMLQTSAILAYLAVPDRPFGEE